jgi:hypothetical protein
MRAASAPSLVLGLAALLLAGGCRSLSCINPETYSKAQEVQRLKMPVGLDGPDTKQALEIPALNEPEVPRDPDGACLEEPPMLDTSTLPAGGPQFDLPGSAQGPDEGAPPRRRTRPGPR